MASSSSISSSKDMRIPVSPPPPPPHSPAYTPIQESEGEEGNGTGNSNPSVERNTHSKHHPTPLHLPHKPSDRKSTGCDGDDEDRTVSCNKCRPTAREKISVVPLDTNGYKRPSSNPSPNPNGIFRSLFSSLTKKSPRSSSDPSSSAREEQWKLAAAELSHKLLQATRKRDEALLEASKLKNSMSELEKKLNKLEIYCNELKSGLEVCSGSSPLKLQIENRDLNRTHQTVESFLHAVSDARSSVRHLSRSLTLQLRQMGGKVYDRISSLLQPYDVKISVSKNPRSLLFYLEALLNRAFYEDFEGVGFQKNGSDPILNPIERCEANLASYAVLKELSWEEVLNKGTRHFSEDFSRYCDRKMSEIVAMLGWSRAWPEPLLQAFFGAAKGVWIVHLLARAVHPSVPIFRVEKGARFEGVYMEDMVGDRVRKLAPTTVRIMVAPGFYVCNNVVKCKVLCRYSQQLETAS
ncbi:IRK-interacting protein [Magnolia sinica]|uniref:IRK-interacting protein n=1 Tax=Magnolia sinica TaxID=86752 RepID=UPI00265AA86E|nr:IRK-interacting protein [Magnolia sinica]